MKTIVMGAAAAIAIASAAAGQDAPPAGAYTLDKNHASITWRVSHLGTSTYVASFDDFDAALTFDPESPETSSLSVSIDVTSLDLDYSNDEDPDLFYNELLGIPEDTPGRVFFRAPSFPTITFESTGVAVTGENTGTVTGDLTLVGQTHPVTLDVTFNGSRAGYGGGGTVVGFSATTTVKRSEWGMDTAVGAIGDDVEVWIEAEFMAS